MKKHVISRLPVSGLRPGAGGPLLAPALLLALLFMAGPAMAHGVDLSLAPGKAACLIARYSDGEPMSYVKVKVTGPEGRTFQLGNTDRTGRFAFVPDKAGMWQVTVSDGMGHRAQVKSRLAPGAARQKQTAPPSKGLAGQPLWARAVWGLSFLCLLAGLLFWFKGRKKGAS